MLGHLQERYTRIQPHTWSIAVSVACAPCLLCSTCMAGHAAWQGAYLQAIKSENRGVGFTID